MLRNCLVFAQLFVAASAFAQPKEIGEAFTFDPQAKTLEPARPFWWNVAVSPDGKTIVTAHGLERGGEWWVWNAQTGKVVTKISEPNVVRFVAFTPDGSLLATANFDNAVRIYDAKSWKRLAYGFQATGGHTAGVNSLSFSGDGKLLATAGLDKTARVWDVAEAVNRQRVAEGNQTVTMGPRVVCEGFEQGVFAVAMSPDGRRLVTGGQDGSVRLWNVPAIKAGATTRIGIDKSNKLSGHGITVECLAYSRDGKRFASGSWDNTAKLYDETGKDIAVLKGHNRGVMAMAFAPDSATLATVSGDHASNVSGEVRLWDTADGKERGFVGKHADLAVGVAFAGDGKRLVTTGRDRVLRIWDIAKRAELHAFKPDEATADEPMFIHALAYSPDGSAVAVGGEGGLISLWHLTDRCKLATLKGHNDTVNALAWSPDGLRLVSGSNDHTAIVWDVVNRKALKSLRHGGGVYAVAIAADGKTVATGGFDKVIRLWNAQTGEEKSKLEGHTASVRSLAFSPDGEHLASGSSDYSVRLWSLTSDKVRELRGHEKVVRAIVYVSRDLLASGGDDGTVRVWNLADGEPLHVFGPFAESVHALAASPKGGFIAAGLGNGRVHVLDPREGQTRAMLSGPTDTVMAVAIAPNGREIAAGGFDRSVRLWSAGVTPASPAVTFEHNAPVRATAIAPNGSTIATGAANGTINIFDAATGVVNTSWKAHDGAIEDLAFSGDGAILASGGVDKAAKVWRLSDRAAVHTFTHAGPVRRIALSAKGTLLATGSTDTDIHVFDLSLASTKTLKADGAPVALQFLADDSLLSGAGSKVYLWDVAGNRVLNTLDGGQFSRVTSAASTADGKLIAIAGEPATGTQRPEDAGFCRVMAVSLHHPTTATQRMNDTGVGGHRLAVSADGRVIAIAGGDGSIRAWEWPTFAPIRKLTAHAAAVAAVAVSSRGEFLVSASVDGTAKRWNAARGEPLLYAAKLLDESKQAWFARVSPDGKVLATGGDDRVLRLRDAIPGAFRTLPGDYKYTFATAISHDGTILATGHLDGTILLSELKTGKLIKKLSGHSRRVWSLAFSADGTRLVSGGGEWETNVTGEVRVWDTSSWKVVHEIAAHDDLVWAIAIAPDSKTFATGSRDHSLILWDIRTGKPTHTLRLGRYVRCLAYTLDGKRLYSCGSDGQLRWWNPANGEQEGAKVFDAFKVQRLRISPDGKYLGLAMQTTTQKYVVAVWSIEKNELVRQFQGEQAGQINDVAISPDGTMLAAGGGHYQPSPRFQPGPVGPWVMTRSVAKDGKTVNGVVAVCEIKIWDVATGRPIAELPGHKYWLEAIQFTPDGRELITAGGMVDLPGEVRFWSTMGLQPKAVLSGHTSGITSARFSPDGSRIATGAADSTAIIWNVAKALAGDARAKIVLKGHKGLIRDLSWSPDGNRLVTSAEDGVVKIWDALRGGELLHIAAHDRPVYGVAFSKDGALVATAAGDWKNRKKGEVRIWNALRGTEMLRLPDTEFSAWAVAFSGDGKLVTAHQDETAVRIRDLKSNKEVKSLTTPTAVRGLALSADGKHLGVTAQSNGMIKIWEVGSWRESHEVIGHPGKVVFTIEFAPDRQTVLSAGGDGAVMVWKLPGGEFKVPDFVPPLPPTPGPAPQERFEPGK